MPVFQRNLLSHALALFAVATTTGAQTPPQMAQPREYAAWAASNNPAWPSAPVRASKAMVVSDEKLASEAGVEVMKKGGNAVDAAVAVGFALAVVEPEAGNIGGGGFMLVRLNDGRTKFVDYRETAPASSSRDMYSKMDHLPDVDPSLI